MLIQIHLLHKGRLPTDNVNRLCGLTIYFLCIRNIMVGARYITEMPFGGAAQPDIFMNIPVRKIRDTWLVLLVI